MAGLPPKIHRRYAAMGRDVDEVSELLERLDNGTGEPLYREIPVDEEPTPEGPEAKQIEPIPEPIASEDVKIEERGNKGAPKIEVDVKVEESKPKPERKVQTSWMDVSRYPKRKKGRRTKALRKV